MNSEAVSGDQIKLRQVLINLLGNAVKFTCDGEILLRVIQEGDRYTFHVTETGPRVAFEKQKDIFESFQQDTEGLRYGCAGLGLAISRRHVEMMGGTLDVTSEPGRGATFSFTLSLPPARSLTAGPAIRTIHRFLRSRGLCAFSSSMTSMTSMTSKPIVTFLNTSSFASAQK